MKRVVILILALAAALSPSRRRPPSAAVPCRDRIYNDWYHDGKIASTYPIACYRDALKHMPARRPGLLEPSDDIRSAMQAALAAPGATGKVPAQIGRVGAGREAPRPAARSDADESRAHDPAPGPSTVDHHAADAATVAAGATSGSGGGVPVPLLVLGGLALLLAAVGAIGVGVEAPAGC